MMNPISLHPDNPRYFVYRGKPTILITSGEHYGAVLNAEFDYKTYLSTLQMDGLNHTRTFSGIYHEVPGSFNITCNTLAPNHENYISPWLRTTISGASDKGNLYDLEQWNPVYFDRLCDFVAEAEKLGIIIEFVFFCPFYQEALWEVSPLNIKNNVNGLGNIPSYEVHTLLHADIVRVQEAVVKKIVQTLNSFDNVIYQMCNEPWNNGITDEWQYHIASIIAETEKELTYQHLISQDVSNGYQVIDAPCDDVSVFNFHYATPPIAAEVNRHLNKPIGLNETGFAGQKDFTYRYQAWEFVMAGGALYNNLDYSFSVGYENGTFSYGDNQPGGGSALLRKQLGILKRFIESYEFIKMVPNNSLIKRLSAMNGTGYLLADPGQAYALYAKCRSKFFLSLEIPEGKYSMELISPSSGETICAEKINHTGGLFNTLIKGFSEDVAISIKRI